MWLIDGIGIIILLLFIISGIAKRLFDNDNIMLIYIDNDNSAESSFKFKLDYES